jgi:CubicO group peptidase (beta-lactamase class C family)
MGKRSKLNAAAGVLSLWFVAGIGAAEEANTDPWVVAGFTQEQRERVRAVIQGGVDDGLIAGASLLLYHGNVEVFSEAFGFADLESRRPFTTDDVVALASISKPHTATTIMMLVDQGKLSFDDPVDRYLPEFGELELRGSREQVASPTVGQLLSHTAGFPAGRDAPMIPLVYSKPDFAAATRAIAEHGLAYRPGTGYAYTELDFVTAARVAQVVTGKDFDDLMRQLLLEPIGATKTTFRPSQEVIDAMPIQYNHRDRKLIPRPPRRVRGPGTTFDPGGSLVGDLDGVARLFLLHYNRGKVDGERLIDPELLELMYVSHPSAKQYGLGFNLEWMPTDGTKPIVRHGGATGTMAWIDFELEVVGVFFTQTPARQVMPFTIRVFTTFGEVGLGRFGTTEIPGR